MGKQGPCCHCGVTSTPLWRNGPPEKPVLCNACGSRWRTKGSLANYIPLHARESFNSDELKVPKIKRTSFKPKEQKLQKKRQSNNALESEYEMQFCDQNFRKIAEGDTSNQSSSESAISSSESVHFGTTDASEVTGSVQSNVWDLPVPSKKRTSMTLPKPSPVEKLTKDLCSILHEEQVSNLSGTLEDDLLYESGAPLGSSEIGYGGVLIKHPNSESVAEESEASSFLVDKSYIINEGYSEQKSTVRSPKRVCRSGGMNPHSRCSTHLEASVVSKVTDNTEVTIDHEGACFSSRGIFSPPDSDRSSTLAPAQFIADSSVGDLLLDMPSIASFPEAELLHHPWRRKTDQNVFAMESGAEASDRPSSSFGSKQSKH